MSATILPQPPAAICDLARWGNHFSDTKAPTESVKTYSALSFENACNRAEGDDQGVSFRFVADCVQLEDGTWVQALDLDNCVHVGEATPWALEVVRMFGNTYTEHSPSGTGLHVWLRTRRKPQRVAKISHDLVAADGDKKPNIEHFGGPSNKQISWTGDQVEGTSDDLLLFDDLSCLVERFGKKESTESSTESSTKSYDIERMRHMLRFVDLSDYDAWIEAGMAIHAETGGDQDGLDLWDEFSQDGRYETSDKWDSFSGNDKTFASIVHNARQHADYKEPKSDVFDEVEVEPPPKKGSRFFSVAQVREDCGKFEFLVRDFLPSTGAARMFGAPKCGKSTSVVDIAMHVVAGAESWCGKEMPQGAGRVAYISGEGTPGLAARFESSARALDVSSDTLRERLFMTKVAGQLIEAKDVDRWIEDLVALPGDLPLRLVVIDTQARNFGPGDENSTPDSQKFVDAIDRLAVATGALVLIVHHTGLKNKDRSRGNSTVLGALGAELRASIAPGKVVTIRCKWAKDFADGKSVSGKLSTFELGNGDEPSVVFGYDSKFAAASLEFDELRDYVAAHPWQEKGDGKETGRHSYGAIAAGITETRKVEGNDEKLTTAKARGLVKRAIDGGVVHREEHHNNQELIWLRDEGEDDE